MIPAEELIREGERLMTICNACRYCEGFCAVFPAMEKRRTFAEIDMNYLANLCHNCTECLQSCQYAPPHAFAVNVPMTLAKIRQRSYEKYCWPSALGFAFENHGIVTLLGITCLLIAGMVAASRLLGQPPLLASGGHADFYAVVPHAVLTWTFGTVFLFIMIAMAIGVGRYVKDTGGRSDRARPRDIGIGLRDALTLKYLHSSGESCATSENTRTPWRRWFHHFTAYGFLFCIASTSVAAVYQGILGRLPPYPLFSAPVMLGIIGGIGLILGIIGLWVISGHREPATRSPAQTGFDRAFMLMLLLTSVTGLMVLTFRDSAAMAVLLIVHLALVLTLFITLPYGKFVHGLYRAAALIQYAKESQSP